MLFKNSSIIINATKDMNFPFYKQQDKMSCGISCLRMIAKYYGKNTQPSDLFILSETNKQGINLSSIVI